MWAPLGRTCQVRAADEGQTLAAPLWRCGNTPNTDEPNGPVPDGSSPQEQADLTHQCPLNPQQDVPVGRSIDEFSGSCARDPSPQVINFPELAA